VGVSSLPPLSERIGLKNKNATDSTDSTDSRRLADDTFELERPGAEVEEQRQPESRPAAPIRDREFFNISVKSVESVAFLF
jgi:hypothetical protein